MGGRELPVGWSTSTGSEIFELVTSGSRGWAKYYSDNGPLFIRIGNLDHGSVELDLKDVQRVTPPNDSEGKRTRLEPNDILISITAELGMIALVPDDLGEAYVNQHVALARPVPEIVSRFLAWYLASESDGKKQLLELKRGATKVGLGLPDIRNLILPLAPLNEQRRIAAKLDTTLAAVEACRQRLDGVAAILKRFRQAVLAAATSGELTREWRESHGEEMTPWQEISLDQAVIPNRGITYGVIKLGEEVGGGVPCLRTSNVRWLRIDSACVKCIDSCISSEYSRTVLEGGEVLVNVRGTLGGVAVAGAQMRGWNVSREIAVVPVDTERFDPEFLAFYIGSEDGQRWLSRVQKGVAYTGINLEDLRSLPIKRPSLHEQKQIVRRVQDLFTLADQLETRLTIARKVVDRLTPALLAKAFRGELVPQDPSDEPASVLLERIRAARQAEAGAGKPSRHGRKKAATTLDPIALDAAPVQPDLLRELLQECGALSERALLAASELDPDRFRQQLALERLSGAIRVTVVGGQEVLDSSKT